MTGGGVAADATPRALARRLRPLRLAVGLQGMALWVPVEKLFMSQIGFDAAPAVHCAVSREHGLEAGSSGAVSPDSCSSGVLASDPSWTDRGAEPDDSPLR